MMDKILKVKELLVAALHSHEALPAENHYRLAQNLMREAEGELLANACVTEEAVAQVIAFTRGSLWKRAQVHVEKLQAPKSQFVF
ncbi:MAG TPA: hypothetical protein VFW62_09580 [bacterium]|nr:hypothetical protein [bacterium]